MRTRIVEAIEAQDATRAIEIFEDEISRGRDAWEIHLSLFSPVQRVLNPPFINPHLPKMYRICKEFIPRIDKQDIRNLVRLEIAEYAGRPKLEAVNKEEAGAATISFNEIESSLPKGTPGETARIMATFLQQHGGAEFARQMLLLGSGYLDKSLGHSISCTAFILLEALERRDQDPWPALVMLADYFHKGRFYSIPPLKPHTISKQQMDHNLLRAASGRGIINLHHTITIYAIERVRHFFSDGEYNHLVHAWIEFMKDKKIDETPANGSQAGPPKDYSEFYSVFAGMDTSATLAALREMIGSGDGRSTIGRYLIKAVCDRYQGDYNPHYLTGLGSALWVSDTCSDHQLVTKVLYQYLDYFYEDLKQ